MRPRFIFLAMLFWGFLIPAAMAGNAPHPFWDGFQKTIEKYLGRPYVLGAVGQKSFDCSGFVWRVLLENGILMKRTTARKLFISLPKIPDKNYQSWSLGSLVFFDNLRHVGIVKDGHFFYHAQVSTGTNLSKFDPYWRKKIDGFRRIPHPPQS